MIRTAIFKLSNMPMRSINYGYVRKKDIDQICAGYGNTTMDKIKMYTRMFAHIGKQGFIGAKNDINLYLELRKKPRNTFTSEDWN